MVLKVLIKKKKYFRRRKINSAKKVLATDEYKKVSELRKKVSDLQKKEMNLYNQSPKIGALPENFIEKA